MGALPRAVFVACAIAAAASTPAARGDDTRERPLDGVTLPPPAAHPRLGERLSFHGRWFGIPVGQGSIEVKGLIDYEGRRAYHIDLDGRTNDVLSKFYPIEDRITSYIDAQTLQPLRFEKHQREGHYRADEVVTFDHAVGMASYHSLLNGSTKTVPLTDDVQDLVSAVYWFRRQPIQPNHTLSVNLYTDEKIYDTEIRIKDAIQLELLKRGTFPCIVVAPQALFKGLLVKRGRIWAYLSADPSRLPLLIKTTTPWGAMSAVLDESSLEQLGSLEEAGGGSN